MISSFQAHFINIQPNMNEQKVTIKNQWFAWRRKQAKVSLSIVYNIKNFFFTEKFFFTENFFFSVKEGVEDKTKTKKKAF